MNMSGSRGWLFFVGLALLGAFLNGVTFGRFGFYFILQILFVSIAGLAAWIVPVHAWRWGFAIAFVGQVLFGVVRDLTGWPVPNDVNLWLLVWALPALLVTAIPSVLAAVLVEHKWHPKRAIVREHSR